MERSGSGGGPRRAEAAPERGPHAMRVIQLWRYPVKSLAGERLEAADLGLDGIPGDRVVQVRDAAGCVMTTFDPDTLEQDASVLKRIYEEFEGTMALDCEVLVEGRTAVGDAVELLP